MKHMLRIDNLTFRLPDGFNGSTHDALMCLAEAYKTSVEDGTLKRNDKNPCTWKDVVREDITFVAEIGLSEYEVDKDFNVTHNKLLSDGL